MTNIIYSKASNKDLDQIAELLRSETSDDRDISAGQFIVARDRGKIIGCVRIKMLDEDCFELSSLLVYPDYRNQSIGRTLAKKILEKDRRRPMYLLTMKEKEGFYSLNGFKIAAIDDLPKVLKNDYLRIIQKPFAKGRTVIAMVIE